MSEVSGATFLTQDANGHIVSIFDPHSRGFPFMVALVVINGIFVIGALGAVFIYLLKFKKQKTKCVCGRARGNGRALSAAELEELESYGLLTLERGAHLHSTGSLGSSGKGGA